MFSWLGILSPILTFWHCICSQGTKGFIRLSSKSRSDYCAVVPNLRHSFRFTPSWLFFRVARLTVMMQIAALRSRLEKRPTDLRRNPGDLGDGALV